MERITKLNIGIGLSLLLLFMMHFGWQLSAWSGYSLTPLDLNSLQKLKLPSSTAAQSFTAYSWRLESFDSLNKSDAIIACMNRTGSVMWSTKPLDGFGEAVHKIRFIKAWKDPFGKVRIQALLSGKDGKVSAAMLMINTEGTLTSYTVDS